MKTRKGSRILAIMLAALMLVGMVPAAPVMATESLVGGTAQVENSEPVGMAVSDSVGLADEPAAQSDAVVVTDADELIAALTGSDDVEIVLGNDISIPSSYSETFNISYDITIDLNGNTLKLGLDGAYTGHGSWFSVKTGKSLTIIDNKAIAGSSDKGTVSIEKMYYDKNVAMFDLSEDDSTLVINNVKIIDKCTNNYGGNTFIKLSGDNSKLIVNNSKIELNGAPYTNGYERVGIYLNNVTASASIEDSSLVLDGLSSKGPKLAYLIQVEKGTVTKLENSDLELNYPTNITNSRYAAALYLAGSNATVSAISGGSIVMNAGDNNSQVRAAAIWIKPGATIGTLNPESVIAAPAANASTSVPEAAIFNQGTIQNLIGGTYKATGSGNSMYTLENTIKNDGSGIYNMPTMGSFETLTNDGGYKVVIADTPAAYLVKNGTIDKLEYGALDTALKAANTGDTVILLSDTGSLNSAFKVSMLNKNDVTLDLSGSAIKSNDTAITIDNSKVTIKNGQIISSGDKPTFEITNSGSKVVLENVTINNEGNSSAIKASGGNNEIEITDANITAKLNGIEIDSTELMKVTINCADIYSENGYAISHKNSGAGSSFAIDNSTCAGLTFGIYNSAAGMQLKGISVSGDAAAIYTDSDLAIADENIILYGGQAIAGDGSITYPTHDPEYFGFAEENPGTWKLTTNAVFSENVEYGGNTYGNFESAFNDALGNDGGTIKLLKSVTEIRTDAYVIPNGMSITVDLNGQTLVLITEETTLSAFENSGTFNIVDNSVSNYDSNTTSEQRGAPIGAGKIILINNAKHGNILVDNNGTIGIDRATLEVQGLADQLNKATAIKLSTDGAVITGITDSSIVAPWHAIWDSANGIDSSNGQYTTTVGDIVNSKIAVTNNTGGSGTNADSKPIAIFMVGKYDSGTNTMNSTIGNIKNCEIDSTYYGVWAYINRIGNITDTDVTTERNSALELTVSELSGDIIGGTYKAQQHGDISQLPSGTDTRVISLGGEFGSIVGLTVEGATGISVGDSTSLESIRDCTIIAGNIINSANNTVGNGISLSGSCTRPTIIRGWTDTEGVYGTPNRVIAIAGCEIDSYLDSILLSDTVITGDILNCNCVSEKATGLGNSGNHGVFIDGIIDNCDVRSEKGPYGAYITGAIGGIKNSTFATNYKYNGNNPPEVGAALYIRPEYKGTTESFVDDITYIVKDSIDNVTFVATNDAKPFIFPYTNTYSDTVPEGGSSTGDNAEQKLTLKNCTFWDKDDNGYKIKNIGEMKIVHYCKWATSSSHYGQYLAMDSDATLNIISAQPISSTSDLFNNLNANTNPNGYTLTLTGQTLTRDSGYHGALFDIKSGGLKLENITLQGDANATDSLIKGSANTSIILGNNSKLTGNQMTSGTGAAINTLGKIKAVGAAVATGNTVGGEENNIYLASGQAIELLGTLTSGANLGVVTEYEPTDVLTIPVTTTESATNYYTGSVGYVNSDAGFGITKDNTNKRLVMGIPTNDTPLGGNSHGSGASVDVTPVATPSGIWSPAKTGVDKLLVTDKHIKYLNGYPGGTFQPDGNMTRAEVAQMFYNLLIVKDVAGTTTFSDVDPDVWYADAVYALSNMGILEGVGDGIYEPERDVTRSEFVTIAIRFAAVRTEGVKSFSDVTKEYWAYDSIMSTTGFGWINGYPDNTFNPNNPITRAEVAAVVNRMLGRSADRSYIDANVADLTTFSDLSSNSWSYDNIMEAANAHDFEIKNETEIWK